MLTVDRKNCLPSSEKSAYRGQKNLLTANGKNSLPNDGKIILPRALVSSYVLAYENSRNPNESKKNSIGKFVKENRVEYIDVDRADEVKTIADEIIATGVKTADAYHTACAILSGCDYMITTDDRLLKYKSNKIKVVDPTEFIREMEVQK